MLNDPNLVCSVTLTVSLMYTCMPNNTINSLFTETRSTLPFKSLRSERCFLIINASIHHRCIQFLKSDRKGISNVTKDFYSSKNSENVHNVKQLYCF